MSERTGVGAHEGDRAPETTVEGVQALPLKGIRVIDWSVYLQAPVACQILGALGADVIKVESTAGGDGSRGAERLFGVNLKTASGEPIMYHHYNWNKKGIAVDLKHPRGREIIYRLVAVSDVFVHNWTRNTVAKAGMQYETLCQYNPRLVYGVGTAYGPNGPAASTKALDLSALARSGIMYRVGAPGQSPIHPPHGLADDSGAVFLAFGIVTALLARETLGIGQVVESSIFGAAVAMQRNFLGVELLSPGTRLPRFSREQMTSALYNFYECKDAAYLAIAMYDQDATWPDFCQAIARPDLQHDARFDSVWNRAESAEQLIPILDDVFKSKTLAEWELVFEAYPDILFSRVQSSLDLPTDPQVVANRYIVPHESPALGKVNVPGLPLQFSKTPWRMSAPAPQLGEHTEVILTETLGYQWDDIVRLKEDGVIL